MSGPATSSLDGSASLDKSGRTIREMFAGVAPRYDLLNHLLSASLDVWWRYRATRAVAARVAPGAEVLDLCCGTGDQAVSLGGRGLRVVAADFCLPMLARARRKLGRPRGGSPPLASADALTLPFAAGRFAAVTVSFGLRNVADLPRALGEIHRVLAPQGQAVFLEFALPERALLRRLYLFYFHRVLPWIGRLLSPRGAAYTYLPSSVVAFPQRRDFTRWMEAAGFTQTRWTDLSGGTVCLYAGERPAAGEVVARREG